MAARTKIIGVHPVEINKSVHLIETVADGGIDDFDIGDITQEMIDQPRPNWQAPYDERVMEASQQKARFAFFFHYLDLEKPLLARGVALPMPNPTSVPAHLQDIAYEPP